MKVWLGDVVSLFLLILGTAQGDPFCNVAQLVLLPP